MSAPPPQPRLSFGQILNAAYRTYVRNFTPLLLIALVTVPVGMLVGAIEEAAGIDPGSPWLLLSLIPTQLVSYVAVGGLVFAVRLALAGQRPSAGDALDVAFERYGDLLTSDLLRIAVAFLALFSWPFMAIWWVLQRDAKIDGERNWWLVLVPFALGIYLTIRWWFIPQAVVLSQEARWGALDDSARAVRGVWWRAFGIVMFFLLLRVAPAALTAGTFDSALYDATVSGIAFAAVLPLATAGETLLYYDLKARQQVEPGAAAVAAAEPDVQGEGPGDV